MTAYQGLKYKGLLAIVALSFPVSFCFSQEFRGLWVDAFRPGFKTRAEVRQLVTEARAGNFNALLVEVRKRGDAYYHSTFEPKASDIASDYDPLADLLEQAHHGGPRLEVHAWIVMYPVWNQINLPPSQPRHIYRTHPEWLTRSSWGSLFDGANFVLDPGHPEVQTHLLNVAMDLVSRYEIDGLHLDYIRYTSNVWGYNETALARFRQQTRQIRRPAPADEDWLQFRRDQVTGLVRKIYLSAIALKPAIKISAATITWAPGITSDQEWPESAAFSTVLQDWRSWMEEGILDLNIPMAYFRQTTHPLDWSKWTSFAKDHRFSRHVALGTGLYLNSSSNALYQLRSSRNPASLGVPADGVAGFSYALLSARRSRAQFLRALITPASQEHGALFATQAQPPVMPWKTSPSSGFLKGVVTSRKTGAPLEGARISLSNPARILITDSTGFYGAVDLPPGRYTIRARYPGLALDVAGNSINPGAVTTQNFALTE